jgi:putative membrane protein
MSNSVEKKDCVDQNKISDHLSNERTLLAWVRTAVGIMAFGFVVVEFSLLTKDLNLALEVEIQGNHIGYSGPVGILIVGTGAVSLLFALLRYHRTKKEIDKGTFRNGGILLNLLVGLIFVISVVLLIYLIKAAS